MIADRIFFVFLLIDTDTFSASFTHSLGEFRWLFFDVGSSASQSSRRRKTSPDETLNGLG